MQLRLLALLVPTLALGVALFFVAEHVWHQHRERQMRLAASGLAVIAALPAVLYVVYYLHVLDHAAWFYELRSLSGAEYLAAGAGLPAGLLAAASRTATRCGSRPFLLALLVIGLTIPYIKPLLTPVKLTDTDDNWQYQVCLQSTRSSCGVASAATILRDAGIRVTEAALARECFTSQTGTEAWYLARAFRQRGFRTTFWTGPERPAAIPVPAIAGVTIGGFGHFIPLVSLNSSGDYIVGDPLIGREDFTLEALQLHYQFTGFLLLLERR